MGGWGWCWWRGWVEGQCNLSNESGLGVWTCPPRFRATDRVCLSHCLMLSDIFSINFFSDSFFTLIHTSALFSSTSLSINHTDFSTRFSWVHLSLPFPPLSLSAVRWHLCRLQCRTLHPCSLVFNFQIFYFMSIWTFCSTSLSLIFILYFTF